MNFGVLTASAPCVSISALCREMKSRENKGCDLVELSAEWDEVLPSVLVLSDSDTLGFHLLSGALVRSMSVMPTPSSVSTCEEPFLFLF